MQIDVIDTMSAFARLEDNWNSVYDADPDSQIFLSWKWLSGWLGQIGSPWLVLAAKSGDDPNAPYVAFFPLRVQTKTENASIHTELNMAGNFAADYTGLLSLPDVDHQVIPAFARYLKQMSWARINFDNFRASDRRIRLLLAHFPKSSFNISETNRVGKIDGIDNNRCPFATLPADWNIYLDTLSANSRQKIRRLLRMLDSDGEYRISHATSDTVERDLNTLLGFWEIKWKPRKGDEITRSLVRSNRLMLIQSFKSGLLFLPTLWKNDRPLAALATLIDARKRAFLFYMTGRDETFDGPPPGMILHAYSIRHAIANGFTEYDFLRGNESYKYSFGVKERLIRCTVIGTRNGQNLDGKIERRAISDVLQQATKLHQGGQLSGAERAYRQVLDIQPRNVDALHRLGQLLATRGDHVAAMRVFKALTAVRPSIYKPWLCLAQSCEALGLYLDAVNAYREVMMLNPELPDTFSKLAAILIRLGRIEDVNAALLSAVEQTANRSPPLGLQRPVMHQASVG